MVSARTGTVRPGQSKEKAWGGAPLSLRFRKRRIDTDSYEAAAVFGVNNDGFKDIVCGAYWYEGPYFDKKHNIADIRGVDEFYDDFGNLPMDVNGDVCTDIITGGWAGQTLHGQHKRMTLTGAAALKP